MRVGLVYETFDSYVRAPGDPDDWRAEYEPLATIEALEEALRARHHEVVRLGPPHALIECATELPELGLDAALCIAEGYGSRNREAWGPVALEMLGVPCVGSDALTLSLTLDKAWTNRMVEGAGVRIAAQCTVADAEAVASLDLPAAFPLFVKPRCEGTAKGIAPSSLVADRPALESEVARVVASYAQPALIEAFVPGAEYTVTVVGHAPRRALAVLQRALDSTTGIGLHALEASPGEGGAGAVDYALPGELTPELEQALHAEALLACEALDVLDFARLDFRLDAKGRPVFLEINPLPTFAPDGTFAILAELEGRSYIDWLGDLLQSALDRLGALPRPIVRRFRAPER